jgi:hypothetical protein
MNQLEPIFRYTCKDLAAAHGHSSTIEWWPIDMADLSSVDAFCQRWGNRPDEPAGTHLSLYGFARSTPQCRRYCIGYAKVNFLSHVLLTLRLLPSLARSAEPRIICTTSCYHSALRARDGRSRRVSNTWDKKLTWVILISICSYAHEQILMRITQVNFLSHVLLTLRLLPSLARSAEPRIEPAGTHLSLYGFARSTPQCRRYCIGYAKRGRIAACDRALHILCNNAGIAESTVQTRITKDGFQLVHQICHVDRPPFDGR